MTTGDLETAIASYELGIDANETRLCAEHLRLVLAQNETLNLTAITSPEDAVRLHVIDSLQVIRRLGLPASPLVDIGSGAGYPGIPIAIAGVANVVLLEATGKKARFLQDAVRALGLAHRISVRAERAEQHAVISSMTYATAVARAVAGLESLVELASPLLQHGGAFVAMKGDLQEDERRRGAAAAHRVGMEESRIDRYELPGAGERRTLVVYRKVGESEVDLPRRPGTAQKRPLA